MKKISARVGANHMRYEVGPHTVDVSVCTRAIYLIMGMLDTARWDSPEEYCHV
jgi:hypothetical protein